MKLLKIDIHTHTKEDPYDDISYNAEELINVACEKDFDVLAITNHNHLTFNEYLERYAADNGILLIPGIELSIGRKHVLILNADSSFNNIRTFQELRRVKRKEHLIIAPHPFHPTKTALKDDFMKNIDIFDAVEYCLFYSKLINLNKEAVKQAKAACLPLVGNSDAHLLNQLGITYSVIRAREKSITAVIEAIRSHQVEVVTTPLSLFQMLNLELRLILKRHIIKK